jgi:hypothetical protein
MPGDGCDVWASRSKHFIWDGIDEAIASKKDLFVVLKHLARGPVEVRNAI